MMKKVVVLVMIEVVWSSCFAQPALQNGKIVVMR